MLARRHTRHIISDLPQLVRCGDKSNEITAIPQLLDMLDLEGSTVTLDAMGCQKDIAQKLRESKADYALALKDNHKTLHTQTILLMAEADGSGDDPDTTLKHQVHRTDERGHGREETRVYTTVTLFKLAESAQRKWRRLNGHELIGDVIAGIAFTDGVKQHAA